MDGTTLMRHKGLSLRLHAASDVATIIVLLLLPDVFGYDGLNLETFFSWGAAALGLAVYLTTRHPVGIWPLLSAARHRQFDYGAALALMVVAPLLFHDVRGLPWAAPLLGAWIAIANALTRYPAGDARP
jgi:hypothetical protein